MGQIPYPVDDALVENPPQIFGYVKYCVEGNVDPKILKILDNGGAERRSNIALSATHMIVGERANDMKLEEAEEVFDLPVLQERWVVYCAKSGKLLPHHGFEAQQTKLFSSLSICTSGIKGEDLKTLWGLVTFYGGRFQKCLTQKTTHLFANTSDGNKYQVAKKNGIKVVCLDWASDCIKAGSLLDEKKYDPQFLIKKNVQSVTSTPSLLYQKKITQTIPTTTIVTPQTVKGSLAQSRQANATQLASTMAAFRARAPTRVSPSIHQVQLSSNQPVHWPLGRGRGVAIRQPTPQRPMLIQQKQLQGGPTQVRTYRPFIVNTQQQRQQQASKAPPLESRPIEATCDPAMAQSQLQLQPQSVKSTEQTQPPGQVQTQQRISPTPQPIQLPTQQSTTPQQHQILQLQQVPQQHSVESLEPPQLLGKPSPQVVKESPSLPVLQQSPQLLKSQQGPQLPQHQSQNQQQQSEVRVQQLIPVETPFHVNERSLRAPPNGFLIGCVFWSAQPAEAPNWRHCILFYGGEVLTEYNQGRVTHVICKNQKFPEFQQVLRDGKRLVTMHWLGDMCSRKVMVHPFYAIHLPLPFNEKNLPLKGQAFSQTGFEGEDRERVIKMLGLLGANYTPYFSKLNKGLVAGLEESVKIRKAREWKIPVVNITFLNELLLGNVSCVQIMRDLDPKFQQYCIQQPFHFDINIAPHLMAAWKTPIHISNEAIEKFNTTKKDLQRAEKELERVKQRKFAEDEVLQLSYLDDLPPLPMDGKEDNKSDIANRPPPTIMFSGFSEKFKTLATEKVKALGARITNDVKDATHLVIWEICTYKLYSALCRVKHIVSAGWIRDSYKAQRFVDETGYTPSITAFENFHKVPISDILKKPNRHVLFKGMTFYLTPGLTGALKYGLEVIIEAAGGQVDRTNKSMADVKSKARRSPTKYLIITNLDDFEYFSEFFYNKSNKTLSIFTAMFIYTCIVDQKVDLGVLPSKKSATKVEQASG